MNNLLYPPEYSGACISSQSNVIHLPGTVRCHSTGIVSLSLFLSRAILLSPSSNDAVHRKERRRTRPSSQCVGFNAEDCLLPVDFEWKSNVKLFFSPLSRENHKIKHDDTMYQFKGNKKCSSSNYSWVKPSLSYTRIMNSRVVIYCAASGIKSKVTVLKPTIFRTVFLPSTESLPAHAPILPYENPYTESSSQIISPYDSMLCNSQLKSVARYRNRHRHTQLFVRMCCHISLLRHVSACIKKGPHRAK